MINPVADEARAMFADELQARGPAWRNAADSVRSGGYGNAWVVSALAAIERALRTGSSDEAEDAP